MISPEQAKEIKTQLLNQLEQTNLPNKSEIKSSIQAMNTEQLEQFLVQNKLIKTPTETEESLSPSQCVFCSIVSGQINSYKVGENRSAIAVLEINPQTRGHVIVIPKSHINSPDKIHQSTFALASDIAGKIKSELNAKDVTISTSNLFGHEIINLIPKYDQQELNQKHQATPEELSNLKDLLEPKPKTEIVKKPETKEIDGKKTWLPRRIP